MYKYIVVDGGTFAYSRDNWKTVSYESSKKLRRKCNKETNKYRIFEIKLGYFFGENIKKLIIKEFNDINKLYKKFENEDLRKIKGGYGGEMEIFAISVLHNVKYEDVIKKYLIKGSFDGSVDAIYYDENNAYIYQIKIPKYNENNQEKARQYINEYAEYGKIEDKDAESLNTFLEKNYVYIDGKDMDYLYVAPNNKNKDLTPYGVIKAYIDKRIKKEEPLNEKLLRLPRYYKGSTKGYSMAKNENIEALIFVNAKKLAEELKKVLNGESIEKLFVENIRGYLGNNKEMKYTLDHEPEMFCLYNNGISIIGQVDFDRRENIYVYIKNPSIINGQQTVFFIMNNYNDAKINKICIPVFIKNISDDTLKLKIAKYNNTQSTIKAIDLLSIDKNVIEIHNRIMNPSSKRKYFNNYYLDINSSGKKENVKWVKKVFGKNVIKLKDFIKLYSVYKNPRKLGEWKNNYNGMINKQYSLGFPKCSEDIANKICEAIILSKDIIKKDYKNYSIADLAIQYLLLQYKQDKVIRIIKAINKGESKKYSKKADIYKSQDAFDTLKKYKKIDNIIINKEYIHNFASAFRNAIELAIADGSLIKYQEFRSFPRGSCDSTSSLLHIFLKKNAIDTIKEIWHMYFDNIEENENHVWLKCNNLVIDITGDHYRKYL